MTYKVPVENYVRSPVPALPESQLKYLQEELKKLERVLLTVTEALGEIETELTSIKNRLTAGGL